MPEIGFYEMELIRFGLRRGQIFYVMDCEFILLGLESKIDVRIATADLLDRIGLFNIILWWARLGLGIRLRWRFRTLLTLRRLLSLLSLLRLLTLLSILILLILRSIMNSFFIWPLILTNSLYTIYLRWSIFKRIIPIRSVSLIYISPPFISKIAINVRIDK